MARKNNAVLVVGIAAVAVAGYFLLRKRNATPAPIPGTNEPPQLSTAQELQYLVNWSNTLSSLDAAGKAYMQQQFAMMLPDEVHDVYTWLVNYAIPNTLDLVPADLDQRINLIAAKYQIFS